jgi:3-deoxy-D-manno-octulosonate 8-phosphate phosphatase (KDO 8-P phosphatase)
MSTEMIPYQDVYPPDDDFRFQHAGNLLRQFKDIHTFIFDVDGVLTNSEVLITEKGELLRKMNVRDGYALKLAVSSGYRVLIITGGKSEGVVSRLKDLGIQDIYTGVQNKLGAYEEFLDNYHMSVTDEEGILYMGDDLPDFEVLRRVGLPAAPQDAAHEILEIVQYVSPLKGGQGCARDVIEKVLRLNNRWR